MIDETLFDAEEKMEKAVAVAKDDLATVRTGRATPNMFSRVVVDYYGAMTPLNQLSSINIPEARMAIIKPYDASQLRTIEKAIRDSDLGLNPSSDGTVLRLQFPPLTAERRKEYVKMVKHMAEEGRVAVRNLRRSARHDLEALEKDGDISADELERAEKEFEKVTHDYVAEIDQMLQHKEQELLEV